MKDPVSIAVETTCPRGGLALGRGGELVETVDFEAASRHATQVVARLADLFRSAGLAPGELDELYVSVGPGSFTGIRVGVTVARTLAQALPQVRCVAVPTALAIAENARRRDFGHLGVVLDCREDRVYFAPFVRRGRRIEPLAPGGVISVEELTEHAPRPLLLIGPALAHVDLAGEGIRIGEAGDEALHLPAAANVWRVGRRLAAENQYTPYRRLVPLYAREPEAVRLWERRAGGGR